MSEPVNRGHDLPVIHPQDSDRAQDRGKGLWAVDVHVEDSVAAVVLGEDLVLTVGTIGDWEGGLVGYVVAVCDGSANHLHTLAQTREVPSDAVLTAAIATAKAAFPNHVRIPEQDRAQAARYDAEVNLGGRRRRR